MHSEKPLCDHNGVPVSSFGCEAPTKCSVSVAEATIVPSFVFHRTLQLQAAHLFCNSFIRSQSAKLVGIFVEVISVVSVAGRESSL